LCGRHCNDALAAAATSTTTTTTTTTTIVSAMTHFDVCNAYWRIDVKPVPTNEGLGLISMSDKKQKVALREIFLKQRL
jgi:hypothetical protein